MERKSTIERNGKKYFMDIIFKHEDYLNYPYVGGYYITGVPLSETLDVNGEMVTYKQYAYEKIELLIEYDKPDEQGLSVAQKVADKHIDGIIAQIEQDKREEQIKEENKRIDIEETLDRANTDLENILKGNKKDNDIHDIFDFGFLNGDMFNFNNMIEEIKAEETETKSKRKSSDRDLRGIEKCKYYTQPSNVTFDDIAGMEETKEEVLEAIDIFKNTEKYEAMGIHKTLNNIMLSGASGCVDKDTEFFNGKEWKKISEYQSGERVLVYNKDGSAKLEIPSRFVKEPCDTMTLITSPTGKINQCLSDDHRIIYFTRKTNEPHEIRCDEFVKNPFKDIKTKYLQTSFRYEGEGINLTDEELRVMVMTIADAYLTTNNTNYATLKFKKERKYNRAKELLSKAKLEFTEYFDEKNQYYVLHYYTPRKEKEFTEFYYNSNRHQMEIILDEVMYWDGTTTQGNRKVFSTNVKVNADFIQFIAKCLGKYSAIYTDNRVGEIKVINEKEYERYSIDYRVSISEENSKIQFVGSNSDLTFTKYNTIDGYKYCFTVSTGMLVLRRNDRIFVTGNCGKTLIVKAISNELDLPLFSTSGDVSDKYVGQTSRNIETLFNDARKYAPSIIFIDEFEAMAKQRTGESNNQEREGGVSTLLAQLDGLGSSEEVMVIVATNLPDVIDEAVQRRFPTKIAISNPDYQTRLGILQINSKNMKMKEDVDLEKIARNLSGFNGGMIAQIMQNAGILAVRRDKDKVGQEELEDSMERVIAGLKSKTKRLNENEKAIVSYHEVGHAILTYLLKAEVIQKISITPTTGSTLGYVLYANEESDDKFLSTKEELLNDIVVSLGGRCAEEVVFGKVTGGCSNDLEKATKIAENMVTKLGMCSDTFGLMSINPNDVFMRERVLTEVNSILMSSYSRAKQVLTNNRHLLDELAKVLIEKEVMTLQDFKEVVDRVGVVVEEEVL